MKIAVVSSGNIPSKWAHSINTVKHADAFNKLGHDVVLHSVIRFDQVCFMKTLGDFGEFYGVNELALNFERDKSLDYFNSFKLVRILSSASKKIFGFNALGMPDPEKSLSRKLRSDKVELCYARSYRAVLYNIENRIPTVLETHNPRPEQYRELQDIVRVSHSPYFRGIVTIHEKIKESWVALGVDKNKIIVLEDAVNLDLYSTVSDSKIENRALFGLPVEKKIVGYLGSLKKGKGIHVILETAAKFKEGEVEFVIAGGTNTEINYWKTHKSLQSKNVRFIGFIPGVDCPKFLRSCDVLFMPYDLNEKDAVMDLETTSPIKLFEYMASNRPLVATELPVISKIITDQIDGILVSDNNYETAILSLLENVDKSKTIANAAYERSKTYTYVNRCKNILNAVT